jgi:regulator of sirC expression with transglutaminase-like and TPR domain
VTGSGEIEALLRSISAQADEKINLGEAALALAALDRPRVGLERYRHHLALLARETTEEVARRGGAASDLGDRIAALNAVLFDRYGYRGDTLTYGDLQNANLMRVIDRRKGLPVTLGILYLHTARAQGWHMVGLSFPGHFLVRLDHDGRRAILDPFDQGKIREVADLRELLKAMAGADAELTAAHYEPVANRAILLRLQNNIKLRLIQNGHIDRAVEVVETMLMFAPDQAALWREAGMLHLRLDNLRAAIAALEQFMRREAGDAPRHHVAALVQDLRAKLN